MKHYELIIGLLLLGLLSARTDVNYKGTICLVIDDFGYAYNEDDDSQDLLKAHGALELAQSGIESSGGFTSKLRKTLGLSELGVEKYSQKDAIGNLINDSDSPSLVIGKMIGKKLYIRYIQDLSGLNPTDILQLKLILNNRLSLQLSSKNSQIDNSTGLDLLYSYSD